MTKEQIKILNDSILNIKQLCKMFDNCIECPMNHNCNEVPVTWQTIEENEV